MLEVVVGNQEDLEFTVRHGESHERQISEVPALLLGGQLSEQRAVPLCKLEVAEIHALESCQEGHGRGGGTANLDDAGGRRVNGRCLLVGGPHLAQRRVALGQVIGRRVTDAHSASKRMASSSANSGGGGSGNDLS